MIFRTKHCALFGMVFLMSGGFAMTSLAGGINGNEQSVVSVIHGQFEQNGIIYSVKPEYISSAMNYLSQDDVNLTADQASQVISEIYANVQTGVESGYLREIGRTAAAPESAPAGEEGGEQSQVSPEPEAEEEFPVETVGEGLPEESLPESLPEETEAPETEPTEPETEAETEAAVISILELVDKAPPQSYEYLSRDTDELMGRLHFSYDGILWFLRTLAAVLVLTAAVAWGKGLLIRHRNHKLRNVLKAVLTVETALFTALFLGAASLWIGAYQDGAVLNKLADTGYYNNIYDELRRDTSISFALLDIPDEVMDNSITYERVVLAARQQVESDLSGGVYQADTSMLTKRLEEDITSYITGNSVVMTEQASRGLELLMERLEEKYSNLLKWPFAPWWVKFGADFAAAMPWLLFGTLALLLTAQVLLVFLHHYKHRGAVLCGKAVMAGGILVCAGSIAGMILAKNLSLSVKPEFMKTFFELYLAGIWRTAILLGGIGILAGVMYLLVVRAWKEGKK